MKRILIIVLSILLLISLTACGDASPSQTIDQMSENMTGPNENTIRDSSQLTDQNPLPQASSAQVMAPKLLRSAFPEEIRTVTAQCAVDDTIWLGGFGAEGTVLCGSMSDNALCIVLPDDVEFVYALCGQDNNIVALCGSYPLSYYDADGILQTTERIRGTLELITIAPDGTVVRRVPLAETYNDPSMRFRLIFERNGEFFVSCQSMLVKLSADGTEENRIPLEDGISEQFYSICFWEDHLMAVSREFFGEASYLWSIDPERFSVDKVLDITAYAACGLGVDEAGALLVNTETALCRYTSDSGMLEELFSWESLNVSSQAYIVAEQHEGQYRLYQPYDDGIKTVEYHLRNANVTELVLATDAAFGDVQSLVHAFNEKQDAVHIRIEVYGEDYLSIDRLQTEILGGIGPDLFAFTSTKTLGAAVSANTYADLLPLLDADPGIGRESIVPNLLTAMMEQDKLYWLPYQFNILTCVAPSRLVSGPGITLAEAESILATLGENYTLLPKWVDAELMFQYMSMFSSANFIDQESATCTFDSESFIQLLALCAEWTEGDKNASDDEHYLMCYEPLQGLFRLSGLSSYRRGGYCFVGFPTGTDDANAFLIPLRLAIGKNSKNADAAWQFLRYAISDDGQLLTSSCVNFCDSQSALDHMIQTALEGRLVHAGVQWKINQADIDKLRNLITHTSTAVLFDPIIEIIVNEASPYFDGVGTAEQCAKRIQSKVSLYLMEQK